MVIPIAPGGPVGGLITRRGQLQYGDMLLGGETSARWLDLDGWRGLPGAQLSDIERPQAHGSYPGDVVGDSATITYTFRVRDDDPTDPDARLRDLQTIEDHTPLDGVERPLVVHDGLEATMRMARVIDRDVPMDLSYSAGPIECAVQWRCADPRRYSLTQELVSVGLASSVGGLAYPLTYPLTYGTSQGGTRAVTQRGSSTAPLLVTLRGPLINPVLSCSAGWVLIFRLTLAAGETLVVDTSAGTALLNGTADRLYTVDALSSPLERCVLPPGTWSMNLSAPSGSGSADVAYRHAYL